MNYELRIKNKTVAAFLFLLIVCGVFTLPFLVYGDTVSIESPIKPKTIPDLICFVTQFITIKLMPPIAVIMMLWASFLYLTSAGQPGKIKQANEVVVWTIIGAGILLLSTALVTLVMSTLDANQQAINTIQPGNAGPMPLISAQCSWESTKTTVVGTILNVVNLFSWFIGVLSVAMALYSGFLFMTSRGNPQNAVKAGKTIFYAIVGITVAVIAYSIIQIVENFVGLS